MAQSVSLFESDIYAPGIQGKRNIPWDYRGMSYIPGGVPIFYGKHHTAKIQGITGIFWHFANQIFTLAAQFPPLSQNSPQK